MEELNKVIEELENWHKVREKLNAQNDRQGSYPRKNKLVMDTLPRAISLLKDYKNKLEDDFDNDSYLSKFKTK